MKNIHRRKPVHSHSGQGTSQSLLTEIERQGYKDDIERLKSEKESLHLQLYRHKQEQEALQLQLQSLTERVQHVEQHQKSMIYFIARALQKPIGALDLIVQSDKNDRKRRLPGDNSLCKELCNEDNQIDSSRMLMKEDLNLTTLLSLNKDTVGKLEASLTFWENLLLDIRQTCEKHKLSGLEETTSSIESPTASASCTQLIIQNTDIRTKTSGIDMNCEPIDAAVTDNAASEEQEAVNPRNAPTGANDVFWEQFLTENPGSMDAQKLGQKGKIQTTEKMKAN